MGKLDGLFSPLGVVGEDGSLLVVLGEEAPPPVVLGEDESPPEVVDGEGPSPVVPGDEGSPLEVLGLEESPPEEVLGAPIDWLLCETGPVAEEDTEAPPVPDGSLGSPPFPVYVGVLEG